MVRIVISLGLCGIMSSRSAIVFGKMVRKVMKAVMFVEAAAGVFVRHV